MSIHFGSMSEATRLVAREGSVMKRKEPHNPFEGAEKPKTPKYPEVIAPVMPPLHSMAHVEFWLHVIKRRCHFKRLFMPLLGEGDTVHEDLSCRRRCIIWALDLPLRTDALKALEVKKGPEQRRLLARDKFFVLPQMTGENEVNKFCLLRGRRSSEHLLPSLM